MICVVWKRGLVFGDVKGYRKSEMKMRRWVSYVCDKSMWRRERESYVMWQTHDVLWVWLLVVDLETWYSIHERVPCEVEIRSCVMLSQLSDKLDGNCEINSHLHLPFARWKAKAKAKIRYKKKFILVLVIVTLRNYRSVNKEETWWMNFWCGWREIDRWTRRRTQWSWTFDVVEERLTCKINTQTLKFVRK